jgi:uncharacterized protein YjbI with pentapeptide repeats
MRFTMLWCLCLSIFLAQSASAGKPHRKRVNPKLAPSFGPYPSPCKDQLRPHGFSNCSDFTRIDLTKKKHQHPLETYQRSLIGSSFEGRDLSGVHFNSADLRYVNFKNSKLHHVIFEATDLRYADFRGADLSAVTFMHSSVDGNTLQLNGAIFDETTTFPGNTFEEWGDPSLSVSIQTKTDAISHGMISFFTSRSYGGSENIIEGLSVKSMTSDEDAEFQILELTDSNRHTYRYKIYSEKLFARLDLSLFQSKIIEAAPAKLRIAVDPHHSDKDMDTLLDFKIIIEQNTLNVLPRI